MLYRISLSFIKFLIYKLHLESKTQAKVEV